MGDRHEFLTPPKIKPMMNGKLENCPGCRELKCKCPKGIGKPMETKKEKCTKYDCMKYDCMKHNGGYGTACDDSSYLPQVDNQQEIREWVTDDTNRIYIRTTENPEGELITHKEVDQFIENLLSQAIEQERERITKMIKSYQPKAMTEEEIEEYHCEGTLYLYCNEFIKKINNK